MSVKMSEAARKARNEYARNWRKKNPDKERETRVRYWEKKAEQMAAAENAENDKEGAQ